MIFLSLGAGVQSTVMLMLAIHDQIERPDHVIFSDTGWEPAGVYRHVAWCKRQCEKAGIPFHTVSAGNIRDDRVLARTSDSGEYAGRWASMPLFVDNSGKIGQIRRQCTSEYKLNPIRKKQRELLGYQPRQRIPPGAAVVQIGISTDEVRRATVSTEKWVDNTYPLIDPMRFSRHDCQAWWDAHYPYVPLAKSACIGCPYKSDASWLELKTNDPDGWEDACAFDDAVRIANGMRGASYLHRSCRPLRDVNLNDAQNGLDLEDDVYCAGGCGL